MGLLSGWNGRATRAAAASRRFAAQVPKTVEPSQAWLSFLFCFAWHFYRNCNAYAF